MKKIISFLHKRQEIIAYTLIFAAAFFAAAVIMYKADWVLGDNFTFILTTAQGKAAPLLNYANIGRGRFFPLAGLDFNILLLIPGGTSAFAHYLFVAASFLLGYIFFALFSRQIFDNADKKTLKNNALFLAALSCFYLVCGSGFFSAFMNVNFSERLIFLLFSLMMFSFLKGRNTGKAFWFALAAMSAVYAAYLKETVPPALFAFSFFSLKFFRKEMPKAEKYAHYAIIANFAAFIAMWLYFGQYARGDVYQSLITMPFDQVLKIVLFEQKMPLFILLCALYRLSAIFILKAKPLPLLDPLLFSSALLICEYLVLGFCFDYYYFPAFALGLTSLFYFVFSSEIFFLKSKKHIIFASAAVIVLFFAAYSGAVRSSEIIRKTAMERAAVMPAMRMMAANFLKGGKIYWIAIEGEYKELLNLTKLYVNFVLKQEMGQPRSLDDSIIERVDNVPELRENDVVLYEVLHSLSFYVPPETLSALHRQGFDLCQYQGGYLMFAKGKCGLFSTAVK